MNAAGPSVEVTSGTSSDIRFTLKGVDTAFANAIRRTMLSEVPTMAIDVVEITENSVSACGRPPCRRAEGC
jgi:DNA-directed RNA polymerase alpha subunit